MWPYRIWLLTTLICAAYGVFIESNAESTELVQQRAGYDVKLQCDLKGLVAENIQIHWYFKHCGEGAVGAGNNKNCQDPNESDWTQLLCEHSFCTPELLLHNVTEHYSGLYKCILYLYRSEAGEALDLQIVRTFQLDVKNESSIAPPELIDQYPINQTVAVGGPVVFQCHVYSELHPTIKWFRRISNPLEVLSAKEQAPGNEKHVLHEGHVYELLSTAGEKPLSDGIYLSKLILHNVRLQDEGVYACVAISVSGHSVREAYLAVHTKEEVESEDYWTEYEDPEDLRSDLRKFWIFFLMPLGLALLPLSVWYAWLLHRRCKRRTDDTMLDGGGSKCSDEEMGTDRAILRR